MTIANDILRKEVTKAQTVIAQLLSDRKSVKILEVGCGSCSYIRLSQDKYIVGIDISEKQLQRNSILNEKIRRDIQDYNFSNSDFDLIVCWWVLEHISQPEKALINCRKALKENGVIVIASPNIFSLKGLVTKYTPHWFHIWVYRYIFGQKLAGIEERSPFRTFLRFSMAPEAIKRFALENGLSVEYFRLYESPKQEMLKQKYRIVSAVWWLIKSMTKILSFGAVNAELTEYVIVLKNQKEISAYGKSEFCQYESLAK